VELWQQTIPRKGALIGFMYQSDKTKWSFLAGIFDGEGSFTCWRTKSRAKDYKESGKVYDSFNVRVTIPNTSTQLMKWLVANFGGNYGLKREATEKHKASYEWRPKGLGNTKRMLLGILPYLVIKREQATLGLEWADLPYDSGVRREQIFQRLKVLNQKGPMSVTTNTLDDTVFIPEWGKPESKIESELNGDVESAPDVNPGSEKCDLPPNDWWCSRSKGHDGPCAARPIQI
jgi:hypothetical protein